VQKKEPTSRNGSQTGSVLVLVLIAALVLSLLGLTALTQSDTNLVMSRNFQADKTALFVADGGIGFGVNVLRHTIAPWDEEVSQTVPELMGNVIFRSGSLEAEGPQKVQAYQAFPAPLPPGMSVEMGGEVNVNVASWQLLITSEITGRWRGLTRKELESLVVMMMAGY